MAINSISLFFEPMAKNFLAKKHYLYCTYTRREIQTFMDVTSIVSLLDNFFLSLGKKKEKPQPNKKHYKIPKWHIFCNKVISFRYRKIKINRDAK